MCQSRAGRGRARDLSCTWRGHKKEEGEGDESKPGSQSPFSPPHAAAAKTARRCAGASPQAAEAWPARWYPSQSRRCPRRKEIPSRLAGRARPRILRWQRNGGPGPLCPCWHHCQCSLGGRGAEVCCAQVHADDNGFVLACRVVGDPALAPAPAPAQAEPAPGKREPEWSLSGDVRQILSRHRRDVLRLHSHRHCRTRSLGVLTACVADETPLATAMKTSILAAACHSTPNSEQPWRPTPGHAHDAHDVPWVGLARQSRT